jgi:hypothetical protein
MKRLPTRVLAGFALAVVLLLGGVASYYASSSPDGLSRVAEDQGISKAQRPHATEDSPLAGYGVRGVGDARLSRGLSGVVGVGVVLLLGTGLTLVVRRRADARS